MLGRGPREVDRDGVAGNRDRNAEHQLSVDRLQDVVRLEPPVGKGGDTCAHSTLGVRVQLRHRRDDPSATAALAQL